MLVPPDLPQRQNIIISYCSDSFKVCVGGTPAEREEADREVESFLPLTNPPNVRRSQRKARKADRRQEPELHSGRPHQGQELK